MHKKGFTLAEVLITLLIIGIVAAFTLPTLIRNYQKHQMIVQLKKAYSMMNEALNLSFVKNGPISEWDFTTANYQNFTDQYILPFIKVTKNCGTGDGCISKTYSYPKTSTRTPKYETITDNMTSFITADGVGVGLINDGYGVNIQIDLDGPDRGYGPYKSTMGRDRFSFYIYSQMKGTMLSGVYYSTYNPTTKQWTSDRATNMWGCQNLGDSCSMILTYFDKWQIKDDYPW